MVVCVEKASLRGTSNPGRDWPSLSTRALNGKQGTELNLQSHPSWPPLIQRRCRLPRSPYCWPPFLVSVFLRPSRSQSWPPPPSPTCERSSWPDCQRSTTASSSPPTQTGSSRHHPASSSPLSSSPAMTRSFRSACRLRCAVAKAALAPSFARPAGACHRSGRGIRAKTTGRIAISMVDVFEP